MVCWSRVLVVAGALAAAGSPALAGAAPTDVKAPCRVHSQSHNRFARAKAAYINAEGVLSKRARELDERAATLRAELADLDSVVPALCKKKGRLAPDHDPRWLAANCNGQRTEAADVRNAELALLPPRRARALEWSQDYRVRARNYEKKQAEVVGVMRTLGCEFGP